MNRRMLLPVALLTTLTPAVGVALGQQPAASNTSYYVSIWARPSAARSPTPRP